MSEEKTDKQEKPKEGCWPTLKIWIIAILGGFIGQFLVSQCQQQEEPTFSDYLEHLERQDNNRYRWR